jgi:ABC-type bacteriocin/lantibiotic exporter with double-glycine peptidase domain
MLRHLPQRLIVLLCLCGIVFAATPGIWLDVPFIKQEKQGCGAASIAMVMQYWQRQQGKPLDSSSDATQIQRILYSSQEHGTRAADLESYLQQHGFQTHTFAGEWNLLKQHLAKGRPLIVALKPSALESSLHYVVVVGVEPDQDVVLLNDAAQRKLLKQERASFEKQWSAVGRWTLLALPKS